MVGIVITLLFSYSLSLIYSYYESNIYEFNLIGCDLFALSKCLNF